MFVIILLKVTLICLSTKMTKYQNELDYQKVSTEIRTYFTALSRSQSANITSGDFPPSSNEHFFILDCAHDVMIVLPISVEPVKPNFRIKGWSAIACPVTEPVPGKMLITPFGKPANTESSANFSAVRGQT